MSQNMTFIDIIEMLIEEGYDNQVFLNLEVDDFEFNESFISDPNSNILFPNEISNITNEKGPIKESQTPNIDINGKYKNFIEIKNDNCIQFFLKAKGRNPYPCKESYDAKIGDIIEKYIKFIKEKDEIKNTFFYGEQKINNFECTIKELGITPLSFIVSK